MDQPILQSVFCMLELKQSVLGLVEKESSFGQNIQTIRGGSSATYEGKFKEIRDGS